MDLSNLLNLINNHGIEKIVSMLSNLFPQTPQNQPNSSQNGLNNAYFKLPTYTSNPPIQQQNESNVDLLEIIKLLLPLLKTQQKKSEPTVSSDFKSEILSLPKVK